MKNYKTLLITTVYFISFGLLCYAASETRIISLTPSQTEMLFHLGLEKQVVAVTDYCNYPAAAKNKPSIGSLELNVERIMALRPTLLVDINNMHKKYTPLFTQLGLNYVNFKITRLEQLAKMTEELTELIGQPQTGADFAIAWQDQLNAITPATNQPRVYFEIWDTPMQAAGSQSFIGDLIAIAGGQNIFADPTEFPVVNFEQIIQADPDIIILAYPLNDLASIEQRPGWNQLRAVKNRQLHALDQDIFIRPGPRNLEGVRQLSHLFRQVNDKQ